MIRGYRLISSPWAGSGLPRAGTPVLVRGAAPRNPPRNRWPEGHACGAPRLASGR